MKIAGLNWLMVAAGLVLPLIAGFLIAWLLWGGRDPMAGNLAATGVILISILVFFALEFVEVENVRRDCGASRVRCVFQPSEFTRYAIYAITGFIDIMLIFLASLWYDERRRRRGRVA